MFNLNKITVLSLTLSLFLLFSLTTLPGIQNLNSATASLSIGQSIQQFQHNLQESINDELRSIFENNRNINSNSNSNCDNNNSISIQSQTNNNGITTSSIWNLCDSLSPSISKNVNLHGKIVSSEYNISTGTIVNSIFGNWSLITTAPTADVGDSIDFNATFIIQPISHNISSITLGENNLTASIYTDYNNTESNLNNNNNISTKYHLSDFVVNSIQQINNDIVYSGNIDVVKESVSGDANRSTRTNTIDDVSISVSVFNENIMFIQFDNQSKLFDDLGHIPLVGVVKQI